MNEPQLSCVALIPARAGSKRISNKNIKLLNGHPLIAYTIYAARQSGLFDQIIVSTNSQEIADFAVRYYAEVIDRPDSMATDTSPDIEWVLHALKSLSKFDCFTLLRPTSPFRTAETIRRGWREWCEFGSKSCDSLRAVELCSQHPGKMWTIRKNRLIPLLEQPDPVPWHSQQYAALPEVYVQNASLEIAWTTTALSMGSIAGNRIQPFITTGNEGFDLNYSSDWMMAESLIKEGLVKLPVDPGRCQ